MEGIRSASTCSKIHDRNQNFINLKALHDQQLEALSIYHKTITEDVRTNSSPKTAGDTETSRKRRSKFYIKDVLSEEEQRGCATIFDLRGLNTHVRIRKFRLISHYKIPEFLQVNDYMTRIDIAQAYFHVPIAENHHQLLRLIYDRASSDDELALWPLICPSYFCGYNELGRRDPSLARYEGSRFGDDFLLASQNRDRLDSQTKEAVSLLESLGWHVNHTKCVMIPSQEIEFLGVIWSTCKNRIILPEKKVQKITRLVTDICSGNRTTLKQASWVSSISPILSFAEVDFTAATFKDSARPSDRGD